MLASTVPQLDDQQRLLLDVVRDLTARVIVPRAEQIDETGEFPWDVVAAFREQGLLGMSLPEAYGGGELPLFDTCLVYQEIAATCLTSSVTLADQKLASDPIIRGGSAQLKQRILPTLASGEVLGAFSLTEPGAGSDIAAIQTRAEHRGDTYVLRGAKCFVTNGSVADLYTVFARTGPGAGREGLSCFVVPRMTPGLSVGRIERKMGLRGSPTAEILLDDCVVPAENLVGQEGDGFELAVSALDPARIVVAFQAIGLAEGALQQAGNYAVQRRQFGRPIIDFQAIQFMLADMAIKIDASRYLAHAAAHAYDERRPEATRLAAEAKTFASDTAMSVTTDAVQVLGGYGYLRDFPVERMMRDAKILQIFDGTNQIQRVVIARELARAWR
ncbi:MAG: acyl-CoA dehydrogenase family protein [Chloroflexi bacterium]|nr:acyl-CoA dehydrogenase family protein [Chloroflexota bacterium]